MYLCMPYESKYDDPEPSNQPESNSLLLALIQRDGDAIGENETSKGTTYRCSGPHSNVYQDLPQIQSS